MTSLALACIQNFCTGGNFVYVIISPVGVEIYLIRLGMLFIYVIWVIIEP